MKINVVVLQNAHACQSSIQEFKECFGYGDVDHKTLIKCLLFEGRTLNIRWLIRYILPLKNLTTYLKVLRCSPIGPIDDELILATRVNAIESVLEM